MKLLKTGDQNLVKQINKTIVFNTIKDKGPVSRAQISKDTGLNKATVSTMVSELLKESFVNEIGSGQSSGGRKPVMLYFNQHAGYSIGIDLGVNYILGILTNFNGDIIEKNMKTLNTLEIDEIINQIFLSIESLMKKAPESPYGIIGIGIGVPGQVDQHERILFAPNLNWKNIDLKKIVEDRFSIPTSIENEANAGATGEQLYGAGKDITNQIYVSIGIGIGTGIIINNRLYRGSSGISGEMGHFTIDTNGIKCSCGNRGCWELYASESALFKIAEKQDLASKNVEIDLDFLLTEAQKGNPKVLQLLNTLGENIGFGIINIINTFNPEVIIIGNRMAQFENWIMNPIKRVLEERLSFYHKSNTAIRFSILGNYSTALGANSFAITNFLSNMKITETGLV
ncbi:ROK family transcriptional regulator [Oceanobacillus caeni]|uniref:ROK family transcriptional regulator n=1 Tax=Oceanobacillus caeni TaxID=405946 RepID=UPI00195E8E85|nr:ROK family protein [Oceanobacillus caeni]MCR1834816.1 ROK family transcriptional regulator [Oceanobacillus caeni]